MLNILKILLILIICIGSARANDESVKQDEQTAKRRKVYVDSKTRSIRDKFGRHLLFHGVNVVYKLPPYLHSNGNSVGVRKGGASVVGKQSQHRRRISGLSSHTPAKTWNLSGAKQ